MLVFVYGTLKRGCCNQSVMQLANGKYVGDAFVYGYACVNTPWYPYAIKYPDAKIMGDVFEIETKNLIVLDRLEGYPNHYDREITQTSYGDCWIYYSKNDLSEEIDNYGFSEEWKQK